MSKSEIYSITRLFSTSKENNLEEIAKLIEDLGLELGREVFSTVVFGC